MATTGMDYINAGIKMYYTDVNYTGALTANTPTVIDNTKDYRNAIAITMLTQANTSTGYSGAYLTVSNTTGALSIIPNVTSTASLVKVRVLWVEE